jgi:hypothetical protein
MLRSDYAVQYPPSAPGVKITDTGGGTRGGGLKKLLVVVCHTANYNQR